MTIIGGIIIFFILLGGFLPYVNEGLNARAVSFNTDDIENTISADIQSTTSINAFNIILSIFSMFFWTFGSLPFWLDLLIFTPLRIILIVTLARNIWVGGGA